MVPDVVPDLGADGDTGRPLAARPDFVEGCAVCGGDTAFWCDSGAQLCEDCCDAGDCHESEHDGDRSGWFCKYCDRQMEDPYYEDYDPRDYI